MPKIRKVMLASLFLLFAVSVNAQKVNVGYDRTVNFSKFKTYAWTKGVPARNPQVNQQILTLIDQQMSAKGLQKVTENADLNLSYHAAVIDDFDSATVVQPNWVPGLGSMGQVWQVKRGTLIVVMKDAKADAEVWRATAVETMNQDWNKDVAKDPNKATAKVKKAIDKIFKAFPPK